MAPSTSFSADLAAYLGTRLLTRRVLLLVLVVSVATFAAGESVPAAGAAVGLVLTALLVAQLRLWDDLADRERDRARHPERLLVRTRHGRSFAWLLVASMLLAVAVLVLRGPWPGPAAYGLLLGLLGLLYHTPTGAGLPRTLRVSLVLTKYPLLVLVIGAGGLAPRATWVALGLYGLLVGFEWRDDPGLRAAATLPGAALAWTVGAAVVLAVFLAH